MDRSHITICKSAILQFYDHRNSWSKSLGSPVTATTSLIGEDLVLALFKHYWMTANSESIAFDYLCKSVGQKGPRLDAWAITKTTCFQTEVKNWCASAIGGKDVGNHAESLRRAAKHNLKRYLGTSDTSVKVWKVLAPMNPPPEQRGRTILPLLAFWSPVAARDDGATNLLPPFFSIRLDDLKGLIGFAPESQIHKSVSIFSASLYLRSLNEDSLTLDMPRVAQRLRELQRLITIPTIKDVP